MFRIALLACLLLVAPALAQPRQDADDAAKKAVELARARIAFAALILIAAQSIPIGIAFSRGHHNAWAITATSLLLGCTCIGWIVAVVWSITAVRRHPQGPVPRDFNFR